LNFIEINLSDINNDYLLIGEMNFLHCLRMEVKL